ncbi:hypothetical protein MtrunA17_Chr2g0292191 [Medicago truncatula]|uniref:Uncharacterized protein n=1 Tax=Medicago truncatula TaxID=3880 RepID=A0A396JCE9_MEDTR|nr:hypothetical protein MtrunA17_Chr2g0292191 [Medicago truncatula]
MIRLRENRVVLTKFLKEHMLYLVWNNLKFGGRTIFDTHGVNHRLYSLKVIFDRKHALIQ